VAIPFDQLPIGEGLCPDGRPGATFFISKTNLQVFERDGPEGKYEDARFVHETVQSPDAVFKGLNRSGHEESLCYSVRPTFDPDDPDSGPPRYGYVFLAFIRPGVGGFVVFDWDWREEDSDAPGHPEGWADAFGERTWLKT
jgi:hypothetical protein